MKKKYIDLSGNPFEVELTLHDISKYDVLYHVTLKERRESIEQNGLITLQPQHKSLVQTDLLFFSYPIDYDTSDCFRWSDERYSLVVLDAKKLVEEGYIFYDDYFGSIDASSKKNHLCTDKNIPKEFIKKILEF